LDRVRVKGKAEPVAIYEPLGLRGKVEAGTMQQLAQWQAALAAYRAQQWDVAEQALHALMAQGAHYLYETYLERIAYMREHPPGADWDGVTTFETK
jgi:adenylate cyclase